MSRNGKRCGVSKPARKQHERGKNEELTRNSWGLVQKKFKKRWEKGRGELSLGRETERHDNKK